MRYKWGRKVPPLASSNPPFKSGLDADSFILELPFRGLCVVITLPETLLHVGEVAFIKSLWL